MRKLLSLAFIITCLIFSISCGGGGGGGSDSPAPPASDPDIVYPIIRGDDDGISEEFLVVLDGILEDRVEPPFEWDIDYLAPGVYDVQLRQMVNNQPDDPVKFILIIIEDEGDDGKICTTYEMVPELGHGQNFKQDKLFHEVCR